jgi:hypothetical protein
MNQSNKELEVYIYTLNGNFGSDVNVILNVTFAVLAAGCEDADVECSLDAI